MTYPVVMNGDHAEFEQEWAGKDPKERPDWPLPSFDAQDWAQAFCNAVRENPEIATDEGTMLAWLSGALMRGYDEASARAGLTTASRDVLAERRRQVDECGFDLKHDDEKEPGGRMALAAACYAKHAGATPVFRDQFGEGFPPSSWPWSRSWWKPTDRRRDLVKAGALILAEIERLDRAGRRETVEAGEG